MAWVVVPFANSFAPGPRPSTSTSTRSPTSPSAPQTADLSTGYYFGNQALVALKASPLAKATTIAELQGLRLGAQVGTTSYDAIVNVIEPTKEPLVYDTNDVAIKALKNKTDRRHRGRPADRRLHHQRPDRERRRVIVGQFEGGTPEHFSVVLAKGSPLTACVNEAIEALTADGTLDGPGQHSGSRSRTRSRSSSPSRRAGSRPRARTR